MPDEQIQPPKPKLVEQSDGDKDELFSSKEEEALDAEFSKEEQLAEDKNLPGDNPDELDDELREKRKRALDKRQSQRAKDLPMGRVKRHARFWMAVVFVAIISAGFFFRIPIVDNMPQFARIYEAVGLKVNVVGLEFTDVRTLRVKDKGVEKLVISADILNVSESDVQVPSIQVDLFDENETLLLRWNVTPLISRLGAREKFEFETYLDSTPYGVAKAKLGFVRER